MVRHPRVTQVRLSRATTDTYFDGSAPPDQRQRGLHPLSICGTEVCRRGRSGVNGTGESPGVV